MGLALGARPRDGKRPTPKIRDEKFGPHRQGRITSASVTMRSSGWSVSSSGSPSSS
jgi:hypothetical protein